MTINDYEEEDAFTDSDYDTEDDEVVEELKVDDA